MSDLALKVNSKIYAGWKEIKIQRGIRRFADTFELTLTEVWAGQDVRRPIKIDSPCQIEIDGETIITGFVDDVATSYDAKNHSVTVNGRSKVGDLVDCSQDKDEFAGKKLDYIAKKISAPFGIKVIVLTDVGEVFKKPILETGEAYHEFLSRLATYRAVHLTSNADGDLVITRAGTESITTALVLGENVLSASGTRSKRDRFHNYIVTGQQAGNNDTFGPAAAHVTGEATDDHIRKARTTVIVPDDLTLNDAKRIAEYERNIRYGESQIYTYVVNGWRHDDGLWVPNKLVHVIDAYMELDTDLLITHVTFIMDEEGQRTELELMPREALDLIPLPEDIDEEDSF